MIEEATAMSAVFAEDKINGIEYCDRAYGYIGQIADRCGHDV